MANEPLWKEFGTFDQPWHFDSGDRCFYARDYMSHGGFKASDGNNLISNFKKKPHLKTTNQWRYKEQAIQQFAQELNSLLPDRDDARSKKSRIPSAACYENECYGDHAG